MKHIAFSSVSAHKHQWLHTFPVAMELANHSEVTVTFLTKNEQEEEFLTRLAKVYDNPSFQFRRLSLPLWLKGGQQLFGLPTPPKIPLLAHNIRKFRRYDAVVVPDITTTILKRLGLGKTKLVKLPHGCGDRDVILDKRMGMFDLTLFPGKAHRDRLVQARVVDPDRCEVTGYPKFEMVERMGDRNPLPFDNERPTVVYIPHFKRDLSSWPLWGKRILEFFAVSLDYNLILAPHVRLHAEGGITYEELEGFRDKENIHIDLGSERCIDMTYTAAADIYLGDVSSQVYEFLNRPRPCIFLNAHGVKWEGDPSYKFWYLGSVVDDLRDLPRALEKSQKKHRDIHLPRQQTYLVRTFFQPREGPAKRAASTICASLV